MGEHTRKMLVTHSIARRRLCLSEKSASTGSHPAGALAASSFDRYMARTLGSLPIASRKTVFPTLPLAPVMRIIFVFLHLVVLAKSPKISGTFPRSALFKVMV